jgi:hypothetical protein
VPEDRSEPRWNGPADARSQESRRLAAAGDRLRAEADRLRIERAYGVVDLGAHARLAGQGRVHRAGLRRFRAGQTEPEEPPPGATATS